VLAKRMAKAAAPHRNPPKSDLAAWFGSFELTLTEEVARNRESDRPSNERTPSSGDREVDSVILANLP